MLLIITHTEDYTVDYVANILNKKGLDFFRLNTDQLQAVDYNILINNSIQSIHISNSNFTSLWFRRIKLPTIGHSSFEVNKFIALDYESLLFNSISSIDFKNKVSDPYSIYRAENKLLQLQVASKAGFLIPKTLLTNSKSELQSFLSDHQTVIKPIRSGRLLIDNQNNLFYTSRLSKENLNDETQLTPAIYQQEISKEFEVRVTVINDKAFAAKVFSQDYPETQVDWRKNK